MNNCERFSRAIAKKLKIPYNEWVKRYPRGPHSNSVYINATQTHDAHCVHCARVEAFYKSGDEHSVRMDADGDTIFEGD
jgi:hypothetical protein